MKHNKRVILQCVPTMVSGGVERGTIDIADAIYSAGMTPLVVSNGGPLVEKLEAVGARHIQYPIHKKNPFTIINAANFLDKLCEEEGVDLIHARSRIPAWAAYLTAKKKEIPFITTWHSYHSHGTWLKKQYNKVMGFGDKVIAISQFMRGHMLSEYKMDAEKITVIPRGTDTHLFHPGRFTDDDKIQLRDTWGVPHDKPLILVPGRLSRKKGQLSLLRALRNLSHQDYHCVFLGQFTGHKRYVTSLQKMVAKFHMPVTFQSHTEDMPKAYAASDIVVYPSVIPEAFGRVAPESQAMMKPVIAFNHGGAAETIIDGRTGFLVRERDISHLSETLEKALTMGNQASTEMGSAGRAHIEEFYGVGKMKEATLALYEEMLRDH